MTPTFTVGPQAIVPFTDPTLTPGVTVIRAVHIMELRTRIDAVRAQYGLGGFGYTDPGTLTGVAIKAVHIQQLRTALNEAYDAALRTRPGYSRSPVAGMVIIVSDVTELRAAVQAIE